MRVVRVEVVHESGPIATSAVFLALQGQVLDAIGDMEYPAGSGAFSLRPGKGLNGVLPIRRDFQARLTAHAHWEAESRVAVSSAAKSAGPIDATTAFGDGRLFAVEWETGNISSSHRAVNKLILGIRAGTIAAAILVLPSREMYYHLTDRIGNFDELAPYLSVFKAACHDVTDAVLKIVVIEHDSLDASVPAIPRGKDGNAYRILRVSP